MLWLLSLIIIAGVYFWYFIASLKSIIPQENKAKKLISYSQQVNNGQLKIGIINMSRKRMVYSTEFKTKLVLELLKNDKTLSEIASAHNVTGVIKSIGINF